jgi:dipeptidyl aminopeptidase/acylaminoacyl peptidase
MRKNFASLAFIIASFTFFAFQREVEGLPWTVEASIDLKTILDVELSPDNSEALVVVNKMELGKVTGTLKSSIYKINCSDTENIQLFYQDSPSASQPKWSPDGNWVAFLITKNGKDILCLASSTGQNPLTIFDGTESVETFAWSPDGKKIAFVMADDIIERKNETKTSLLTVYKKHTKVNRLWIIDPFMLDSIPTALTTDEFCVRGRGDGSAQNDFDWSPDSQAVVFAYSLSNEADDLLDSSLAIVDVNSAHIETWQKFAPFEATPRFSPSGETVAYLTDSNLYKYSINRNVAIRSNSGNSMQLLSSTYNGGPHLVGPNLLGWSYDGNDVIIFEPKGTKFNLIKLPADGGKAQSIDLEDLYFSTPSLSQDRTMVGIVMQGPSRPPEAAITSLSNFQPRQISTINCELLKYDLPETEVISWKSNDGLPIEALLTYPSNYMPGQKYPLLLLVHGGPMSFFFESFIGVSFPYPIASFADKGFMILRPNPRGSTGYGVPFRCAVYNDWGGMDYIDLMTGVDHLIANGMVDSEKLGIMGWSYGGYLSAWTITQTSRFKAASVGAGVYNLVSFAGTTDIHLFISDYFAPFQINSEILQERSPLFHVQNVTTPCLLEHGVVDPRVPLSQSLELYHAFDRENKEKKLILYPRSGHSITDPNMIKDRAYLLLDWFQKYLSPND